MRPPAAPDPIPVRKCAGGAAGRVLRRGPTLRAIRGGRRARPRFPRAARLGLGGLSISGGSLRQGLEGLTISCHELPTLTQLSFNFGVVWGKQIAFGCFHSEKTVVFFDLEANQHFLRQQNTSGCTNGTEFEFHRGLRCILIC